MPKYKIGDIAWYASYDKHSHTHVLCPVCYGKLTVRVILGNDDEVTIPCDYCRDGLDTPRGYVGEYQRMVKAVEFKITGIENNVYDNKENVEYRMASSHNSWWSKKEHELFDTKEEALRAAETLKEQDEKNENEKTEYLKFNKIKSFSWNAGYHMRQVKDAQKQIEYHSKKAVLCKAKVKQEKEVRECLTT